MKVKSLSRVRLFATPWTVAHQAPPSMGFSKQEYWSGLPFPSPGDLPDPRIKPRSPTFQADTLTSEPPGKPNYLDANCRLGWCCLPLYPYPIYNHHFRNILTTRPRHSRFDCLHYSLSHGSANYQIPCLCCINLCWVERILDPLAFPWWWRSLSISLYLFRITEW